MARGINRSVSEFVIVLACILACPGVAWLQEAEQSPPAPARHEKMNDQKTMPSGSLSLPDTNASESMNDPEEAASGQPTEYIIKKNDTLWDIASAHYRDPFLWPLIWQANPSIKNPDLIYPGQSIIIPNLAPVERAMSAPQEPAPVQEQEHGENAGTEAPRQEAVKQVPLQREPASPTPSAATTPGMKLIAPEETKYPLVNKFTMLSAGFVSEEESDDYILGSTEDPSQSILSNDESVYISVQSRPSVAVGDRFLIFQPDHKVLHPVTKRNYGNLYRILGILDVTKVNEQGSSTATATIIKSFDAAEKGSLLKPYEEPPLIYPTTPRPVKNLTGYILEVTDHRSINAQTDFVYLDKGKEDGVDPGDRFTVFAEGGSGSGVSKAIAELEVFLVKQRTSTAIVTKSVDVLSKGDPYASKN